MLPRTQATDIGKARHDADALHCVLLTSYPDLPTHVSIPKTNRTVAVVVVSNIQYCSSYLQW